MAYQIRRAVFLIVVVVELLLAAPGIAAQVSTRLNLSGPPIVSVTGEFETGDEKTFVAHVLTLPEAIIEFESPGGNLLAGIEIGRAIRLKGFTTSVRAHSICASACAFAWLGGARRQIQEGGLVGFHAAYTLEAGVAKETGVGNAILGSYLNQLGFSQKAIEYVTIAPPNSIVWLTKLESERFGIQYDAVPSLVSAAERQTNIPKGANGAGAVPPVPAPPVPTTNENKVPLETQVVERDASPSSEPSQTPPDQNIGSPLWQRGVFEAENNFDILGCDYANFGSTLTSQDCEQICKRDSKCTAYTFQISRRVCFLKKCAVWGVRNDDFISGLDGVTRLAISKIRVWLKYGVDFPGNDYKGIVTAELVDCVRACNDDARCKAFSYVSRKKQCWLKSSLSQPLANRRVVSGQKGCGLQGVVTGRC